MLVSEGDSSCGQGRDCQRCCLHGTLEGRRCSCAAGAVGRRDRGSPDDGSPSEFLAMKPLPRLCVLHEAVITWVVVLHLYSSAGRIAWVARRGDRRLHRRETGRYLSVVGGGKPWIVDRELGRLMGEDDRFLQLEVGCYLATSFRTHVDRGRSGISNDTVAQVIGRVSEAVCTRGVISDASVLGVVKGHDPTSCTPFLTLAPSTSRGSLIAILCLSDIIV
ncbi:hypothetical protein OOU_Y34scaffold00226g6 [Pyricularia oryzae Y34]|uniref:Uncharacterized protein n=1 Tax=Pyricularia oryzae (strain Y34) TaxID=1143189 RepID=A0AA97P501_PYRO3|nr:hypothetical protein OOU_Y34scaffold00226g6 [Pyricularia oryzae Y34]